MASVSTVTRNTVNTCRITLNNVVRAENGNEERLRLHLHAHSMLLLVYTAIKSHCNNAQEELTSRRWVDSFDSDRDTNPAHAATQTV